ncbi:hexosaminidase D [Teleopsis dalmanni]|uniref:hexosaminidase D n=1 Tax=Teleopsis dalmanni TaxID=139649 RepID=UPI0018CF1E83|nr:hexosaminidase D [Teleopsis dalmanni]
MHSNLILIFWRRKFSILLLSTSLIIITLWFWTFIDTQTNSRIGGAHLWSDFSNAESTSKETHMLQKLISQANRVLRYQQQLNDNSGARIIAGGIPAVPAAAHRNSPNDLRIVRFVKGTRNPSEGKIKEVSSNTLSLVARRKKSPVVGESYLFEEERLKILENQQRVRNAVMEDLNQNNMDYERTLTSAERQTQYEHELQRMGVPVIASIGPENAHPPNERLVHLDLKGAPPKLNFLKHLLPVLKTLGATGLLIEYEDMFPYTGVLQGISANNAYKPDELRNFLETASMHGLTIMPLVQTFGHMEYALKLQGFEQMREIPESPQSICPSQKDSIAFIENMLTQVIEFHVRMGANNSNDAAAPELPIKFTHIHIGCDEVYRMAECDKCRQHSRHELFLTHVTTIANFVRTRWPHLRVVIWDDMLRDMTLTEMQHSHIGNYVEPMIWVYANDIYHFIQPQLWDMYSKVFTSAWAASAFKGAFGESLMIPPLQQHLENNMRWLAVIAKEGGRFSKGFNGLALTGWQRYDHFATLCELLPISMPSLITSLSTVSRGYFSTNPKENDLLRVLECVFHPDSRRSGHPWIELHPNSHHSQLFSTCTYLGSHVYKFALRLFEKLVEVQNYLSHVKDKSAWLSDYNLRHNFSSPIRVRSLTTNTPPLINELTGMAKEAHQIMIDIFDEHTIAEFIEQNIYPLIVSLRKQLEQAQTLLQRHTWPQRPLPFSRELIDLSLLPDYTLHKNEHHSEHTNT